MSLLDHVRIRPRAKLNILSDRGPGCPIHRIEDVLVPIFRGIPPAPPDGGERRRLDLLHALLQVRVCGPRGSTRPSAPLRPPGCGPHCGARLGHGLPPRGGMTAPLISKGGISTCDRAGQSKQGGVTAPLLRQGDIITPAYHPTAEWRRVWIHPHDWRGDTMPPSLQVDGIQSRLRGVEPRRWLPDPPSFRGHPYPTLLSRATTHSHQPIDLLHKPIAPRSILFQRGCSIPPSATPYAGSTRCCHRRCTPPPEIPHRRAPWRTPQPAAHPLPAPRPPPPPRAPSARACAPGICQWLE